MAIYLYSGTPGSGKSYHVVLDAWRYLSGFHDHVVISNFYLTLPKKTRNKYIYLDNSELTPERLVDIVRDNPISGREGRYICIIDEAQLIFNARSWDAKARASWISFFTQHRKYGYDIYLIAQFDRMLDRQVRCLIETEVRHRKMNNYKHGWIFSLLFFGKPVFMAISYWYGGNKIMLDRDIMIYSRKIGKLYDTYTAFDGEEGYGVSKSPG